MNLDDIVRLGKCCTCEGNINSVIVVQLNIHAPWKFPVWGNFITGVKDMALAYICERCEKRQLQDVKFAVQFKDTKIVYHPIEWMKNNEGTWLCQLKVS